MATGLFSPTGVLLEALPYCGAPATPLYLWSRWNLDPWLIAAFGVMALAYGYRARADANPENVPSTRQHLCFAAGWTVALLALISPLCALAIALFSVRVGQHMVLVLLAAPLLAMAMPVSRIRPWAAGLAFFLALWLWHFPPVYAWSLRSDPVYWLMQLSLIASAVGLWRAVLSGGSLQGERIAVGIASTAHMGLLGALLTFATRPFYAAHRDTTQAWGLSALADQQLAGLLMWVPGGIAFGVIGLAGFLVWWKRADADQVLPARIDTQNPLWRSSNR